MSSLAGAEVRTVAVGRGTLAYVERGQGQSVVFVHGGYSDLRTRFPQLDAFAAGHRTVAYSRRYARPNEDIPEGQDDQIGPHVDDLLSLIRSLDLAPAHLVGNSWGAFICLLAALKEPDLVHTIVLGEPPVLPLFIRNSPTVGELVRLFLRSPRDAIQEERKQQMRENHTADSAQLLGAGFPPLSATDIRRVRGSPPVPRLEGDSRASRVRVRRRRAGLRSPVTSRVGVLGTASNA